MSKLFLIEYSDGKFVNGLLINWIRFVDDKIEFTTQGDNDGSFVDDNHRYLFVNHLSALNGNTTTLPKQKTESK